MNTKGLIEFKFYSQGHLIAGVDEVGRGCLAGPVYAAAVILDYDKLKALCQKEKDLIRDSKTLSEKQRSRIIPVIQSISLSYGIASASVGEIENFGIVPATFLAMRRSIEKLDKSFKCLLVDGNRPLSDYSGKQMSIIKGDSICYNIASSSILAKQARDSFMNEASEKYPCYGFDTNVGYGTKKHLEALKNFGASPLHRSNFSPMREMR